MTPIIPAILCGGSGTRLWPLSRESHPKQFVDLGDGQTLFKSAVRRAAAIEGSQPPIIICNEKYRFYVQDELRGCSINASLILEPSGRNTGPAIAMAALAAKEAYAGEANEPLLLVLPSDHHLQDDRAFLNAVREASILGDMGMIVTFGIKPTHPATGFGYIRAGKQCGPGFLVSKFIEKPDTETAKNMIGEGVYFWNSGMFLAKPSIFLREIKTHAQEIYGKCLKAFENRQMDGVLMRPDEAEFISCPEDSIDYAVMERTDRAAMLPVEMSWNDMGSWESFFQDAEKDANNNAVQGDVILDNVDNCYLHSSGRLLAAIGISNISVIETSDAVLVARRDEGQKVKNIVNSLKKTGRYQYKHHPLVYRPWGSYERLAIGDRFQVKRIIVNPGEVLSLQIHHHRAEHWIIVSGTAEITNGDDVKLYTENQSTYIPVGCRHRLKNPGKIPLIMIEIQSGSYLGEDDIVRLEDIYGRKASKQGK